MLDYFAGSRCPEIFQLFPQFHFYYLTSPHSLVKNTMSYILFFSPGIYFYNKLLNVFGRFIYGLEKSRVCKLVDIGFLGIDLWSKSKKKF